MVKRLNIFVDETGEFGFGNGASRFYGVSFTFHEQDDDIISELSNLNNRLEQIGYTDMIHMADLIMHRGEYAKFDIKSRKSIFNAINQMIKDHEDYFKSFDKIVLYYDNGQEPLGYILESLFIRFDGFEHKVNFDHNIKRKDYFKYLLC